MVFLKKRHKLTPEKKQQLLTEIGNELTDQELILLVKALQKPMLKQMALSKLKEYV